MSSLSFLSEYLRLIAAIERRFAVSCWRCGDIDLWPLVRFDLYLDMYRQASGEARPRPRAAALRFAGRALQPLRNMWRLRDQPGALRLRAGSAGAAFLGDGVSLDLWDGKFEDRCGEPLMAALERQGQTVFAMQAGDLSRRPWARRVYAANGIAAWGSLLAPLMTADAELPGHAEVLAFLAAEGIAAPSLARSALMARAKQVLGEAALFERLLTRVAPRRAFVTSWYAGLGPAFILSCRRRRVFCVGLQHAPLQGAPMAYGPHAHVPAAGYASWPNLIWAWNAPDAAAICEALGDRCQVFAGGALAASRTWTPSPDQQALLEKSYDREILVALQPLAGYGAVWERLAETIEAAPPRWRWWLRRHPTTRPEQDRTMGRLLSLRRDNVVIAAAGAIPLRSLLGHMHAVVSLASGAAAEAAEAGVPAFFLSEDASAPFAGLIAQGAAQLVSPERLEAAIAALPREKPAVAAPFIDIDAGVAEIECRARQVTA